MVSERKKKGGGGTLPLPYLPTVKRKDLINVSLEPKEKRRKEKGGPEEFIEYGVVYGNYVYRT